MTLTRILPTLRRSIPDPIQPDFWPELTTVTTTDVVVSGISLAELAEVCGTPCVHGAPAVIPGTGGRASLAEWGAILVIRITAVAHNVSGNLVIQTDARLDTLRLVWSETRLIGRASTSRAGLVLVVRRPPAADLKWCDDVFAVDLPSDLHAGDLLAIPSRSIATTWALQPHPLTGTCESIPVVARVDARARVALGPFV